MTSKEFKKKGTEQTDKKQSMSQSEFARNNIENETIVERDTEIEKLKKIIKDNALQIEAQRIELDRVKGEDAQQIESQRVELELVRRERDIYLHACYEYKNSASWRVTAPMRAVSRLFYPDRYRRAKNKNSNIISQDILPSDDSPGKKYLFQMIRDSHEAIYHPLVTVAIPVYDRTEMLVQSIDSILNQTYDNIEIIAVCDGSPDETLKIVKDYESKGLIRAFYYPDNSGNAVRGRNRAIQEARGEYLAFQDSDDVAAPDRIETSVSVMESEHVDVVYGAWKAIVDGSRKGIDIADGQITLSRDCDLKMLKKICVPCQSTVMVRIGALRRVGGLKTKLKYREDHELWLRLAYYGYKFKSISHVLTGLRLHANNLEISMLTEDKHWKEVMLEEYKIIENLKPTIAYLIPGCGLSGGIAVICEHVNRLQHRGYNVLMVTEDNLRSIDWFPRQRVPIYGVNEAKNMKIDILVATGWTTAYTAQKINAGKKYYFVQSDETRFTSDRTTIEKTYNTYKMNYKCFTEARWIQKWLNDEFGKKAAYVPNGVDEEIIHMVKTDKAKKKKIRVLLEGPIDIPFKGMEDAFNAVKGLNCEVWCVSSAGVPKPEWKCDLFFGKVSFDQMRYIYSNCDILLKMSRVEGFFGPPLEMMKCGGTCVVGKVSGYDEYIIDGYNALTVELGDSKGAHNALKRLINDPKLLKQLKEGGRKTAENWKWETSIDRLEKLFLGETID